MGPERSESRPTGGGCVLGRQQIVLAAINLVFIYLLYEAHRQVRLSQHHNFLQSIPVRHVEVPPGGSASVPSADDDESDVLRFDGVPIKRHVLNVMDNDASAAAEAERSTTAPDGPRTTTPLDISAPVQCDKLAKSDPQELERAARRQGSVYDTYRHLSESDILSMTRNCSSFAARYRSAPGSAEEAAFPLAFGIRMHWKVDMAERLLRAIYHPQNVYCISIDSKSSNLLWRAMQAIADCLPNVFLASRQQLYYYASYTAVAGDLRCMEDTLRTKVPWRYYFNLAGQEYPLKTNLELVRMLKLLNGSNDIESYPLPREFFHRVRYSHHVVGSSWKINFLAPKAPFTYANISLRKGCSYNTYSRPFVVWVLNDPLPQAFIRWANDTNSPDELVWATLNALPAAPGGYPMYVTQVAKTFLSREIVWQWGAGYCQGKLIRHICTFSLRDFAWLSHRWEFFANKFDSTYDHTVLDCIDERLSVRERQADPDKSLDWERLRNMPHIAYRNKGVTPPPQGRAPPPPLAPWHEHNAQTHRTIMGKRVEHN